MHASYILLTALRRTHLTLAEDESNQGPSVLRLCLLFGGVAEMHNHPLIQPRGVGGSEVEMIARSFLQPLPHPRCFVSAVVV